METVDLPEPVGHPIPTGENLGHQLLNLGAAPGPQPAVASAPHRSQTLDAIVRAIYSFKTSLTAGG
jgi:hypothetical protein